ncbi:MAG: STAS domain-containing protein [Streptomycetales bacterium]
MSVTFVSRHGDRVVLAVTGELQTQESVALLHQLEEFLRDGYRHVVLDVSAVSACNSAGIAALTIGNKDARARGGWLRIAGLRARAWRVGQLVLLGDVFTFYDNVTEATAA